MNLENNIKGINKVNESIKKCNDLNNFEIIFNPEEDGVSKFLEEIKIFGGVNVLDKNVKNEMINFSSIIKNDDKKLDSIIKWIEEKIKKKNK